MDHETIVYGCIKSATGLKASDAFEQTLFNKRSIYSLPLIDDAPGVTQDMFSTPRFSLHGESGQTTVIHFGSSYPQIHQLWPRWLDKFEALLKKLYWHSVSVHIDTELTGIHTFRWESIDSHHAPGKGDFNIQREWDYELGINQKHTARK